MFQLLSEGHKVLLRTVADALQVLKQRNGSLFVEQGVEREFALAILSDLRLPDTCAARTTPQF